MVWFALRRIPTFALIALAAYCAPGVGAEQQRHVAPTAAAPAGERRVALVIGNSSYKSAPLRNPVNDARAVSKALAATGFAVTLIEDATQATMWRAIRIFGDQLQGVGSVGLFYYAGHGVQVRGRNYLVPVNADLQREDEVEFQAIDANSVLAKMDSAKNVLNLMILDACRNNPFARGFRSTAQGLAQMDAPSGTLVAFATAPGAVASDGGDGPNGVYTKHLLANLTRPGLPVELMFKQVRIAVSRETRERQIPWEASSLRGNFSFVPGDPLLAEQRRLEIENAVAAERAEQQRRMEKTLQEMLAKQRAQLEEEMRKQEAPSAQAEKPVKTMQPVPATQVASIAPSPLSGSDGVKSLLPKVGDYWEYRYVDRISKRSRTARFEIIAGVSGERLLESGGFSDLKPETRALATGIHFTYREFWELSPYVLGFRGLKAGEKWSPIRPEKTTLACQQAGIVCRFEGRVAGPERVTTPAGTFDAVKIIIDSNTVGGTAGNWRQMTFWYSETAKRVVKSSVRTRSGISLQADYDLELTSYKLN